MNGVGRLGPAGQRPQPGQRRAQGAPGLGDAGHDGTHNGGAVELASHVESHLVDGLLGILLLVLQRTCARRRGGTAQDHDDGVSSYGDQAVGGDLAAGVPQMRAGHGVQAGTGGDGHYWPGAAPARGACSAGGVGGGVVEHGVHGDGFQARVPGSAGLSRVRIDLCGGEAHIAAEGEHQDAHGVVVLGGDHLGGLIDDDVQYGAHQGQGLFQGDGAGQCGGCHVEDP